MPTLTQNTTIHLHQIIHQRAVEASTNYKKSELELMEAFEQVEKYKVYLEIGHSSLFQYGVKELNLSESVVYNLISVMRKTREVPQLKTELQKGSLTLSNAKRIVSVLKLENQEEWLTKATTLSSRQLEKEVVKIHPMSGAVRERASYVTENRVKLELGISETEMLKLRKVQNLVSQSQAKHCTLEETLVAMTDFFLQHKDPVQKAKRIIAKKGMTTQETAFQDLRSNTHPNTNTANTDKNSDSAAHPQQPSNHAPELVTRPVQKSSASLWTATPDHTKTKIQFSKRTSIPASILHQVNLRDERRCTHLNTEGNRCNQARWTEIHHLTPVEQNGSNTLENLITLCSAHHRHLHRKMSCSRSNFAETNHEIFDTEELDFIYDSP